MSWSYFRCCLVRTLLVDETVPVDDGGGELKPTWPRPFRPISDDGLTYTFSIKPGVMYATAAARRGGHRPGLHPRARARSPIPGRAAGGYRSTTPVIEGFDDYGAGKADSITRTVGTRRPTLTVTLTDGQATCRGGSPCRRPRPSRQTSRPQGRARRRRRTRAPTTGRFLVGQRPLHVRGQRERWTSPCPAEATRSPSRATCPGARSSWSATPRTTPRPTGCVRRTGPDRGDDRRRPVPTCINKVLSGDVDYVKRCRGRACERPSAVQHRPRHCSRTCTRVSDRTP